MKMTKKVLGMVLCGVMTVGMITGCGGSDSIHKVGIRGKNQKFPRLRKV